MVRIAKHQRIAETGDQTGEREVGTTMGQDRTVRNITQSSKIKQTHTSHPFQPLEKLRKVHNQARSTAMLLPNQSQMAWRTDRRLGEASRTNEAPMCNTLQDGAVRCRFILPLNLQ